MTEIDKQIEAMGYEEHVIDLCLGYIVYENKEQDHEVTIEWDDEDENCHIFSQTITREKDWFGHTYQMPMGLSIRESDIFIAKIDEMRHKS